MTHMYWTVLCKCPDCGTLIEYSYAGDLPRDQMIATRKCLGSVDIPCPTCGKTYTYTDDEIQLSPMD
jgi:endogenous inhibitor of DNA gyrase (YacG/DUF329 family)